jgi:sterol desaturase/sphingolipid hydroxylase (fatty acid hydroxylase superfamily)
MQPYHSGAQSFARQPETTVSPAASRYILLAVLLLLLANFPLLSAANRDWRPGGFPVLFIYIGAIWVLAIVLLFLITRRYHRESDE